MAVYNADIVINTCLRGCALLELEGPTLPDDDDDDVVARVCPQMPEPTSRASGTMTAGFPPST